MKYLFVQYFCITNIYLKSLTSALPSDSNSINFEIDDFIRQLLSSQKFDELVDKIAEKAVNKIKKFEQRALSKPTPNVIAKNATFNQDTQYRHRDIQHKTNSAESNKVTNEEIKRQTNKIGKINSQAFMKKDAALKSENLSLKFKYLTQKGKSQNQMQIDTGSMVLRNNEDIDRISQKHSTEGTEEENVDDKENQEIEEASHDKDKTQEKHMDENAVQYDDENTMTNVYHKEENKQADYDKKHEEKHSEEKNIPEQEYEDQTDELIKNDNSKTTKRHRSNYRKPKTGKESNKNNKTLIKHKKEQEVKNIDKKEEIQSNSVHSDESNDNNEVHSDDNKVTKQDDSNNYPEIPSDKGVKHKRHFRREDGKLFVFQSSPEYQEYHEEYDKHRKEKHVEDYL